MSHRAGLRACILALADRFTSCADPFLCILHDQRNETYIACTTEEAQAIQKNRGDKPLRSVFCGSARELATFAQSDQLKLFTE